MNRCFCGRVAHACGLCRRHYAGARYWRRVSRGRGCPMVVGGVPGRYFDAPALEMVSAMLTLDIYQRDHAEADHAA